MAAVATRAPHYPDGWEHSVYASSEGNDAELFLAALAGLAVVPFKPEAKTVHLVLHLATVQPATSSTDHASPSSLSTHALSILDKLLAVDVADLLPSTEKHFQWTDRPLSKLDRAAARRMEKCEESGIWALLHAYKLGAAPSSQEADASQLQAALAPTDEGWALLRWLMEAWKRQGAPWPSLCEQLPRLHVNVAHEDVSAPLAIVTHAYTSPAGFQHREVAIQLFSLLCQASRGLDPLLLAASYSAAALAALRLMTIDTVLLLVADLSRVDSDAAAYLAAVAIEDETGLRKSRAEARRQGDWAGFEGTCWSMPTAVYALDLFATPVASSSDPQSSSLGDDSNGTESMVKRDDDERHARCDSFKSLLLTLMTLHRKDADWSGAASPSYRTSLAMSAAGAQLEKRLAGLASQTT